MDWFKKNSKRGKDLKDSSNTENKKLVEDTAQSVVTEVAEPWKNDPNYESGDAPVFSTGEADDFEEYDDAKALFELDDSFQYLFKNPNGGVDYFAMAYPLLFEKMENADTYLINRACRIKDIWEFNGYGFTAEEYSRRREENVQAQRPYYEAAHDFISVKVQRPTASFSANEKIAFLVADALALSGQWSKQKAGGFKGLIAWGNGKCQWVKNPDKEHPIKAKSPEIIDEFLRHRVPDYDGEIQRMVEVGRLLASGDEYPAIKQVLEPLVTQETSAATTPSSALSGILETRDNTEFAASDLLVSLDRSASKIFGGDESLLTVGAPGSGKTQAQVIPALVSTRHSMVVLDVKGELLSQTAGYLQTQAGDPKRILRFSLLDDGKPAHCYNPMVALPSEAKRLWRKAAQMAELLLPERDKGEDIWLGNARTLLACHICAVKLEKAEQATLKDVMTSIRAPVAVDEEDGDEIALSAAGRFDVIAELAKTHDMPELAEEARSLSIAVSGSEGESSKVWQSILLSLRPLQNMMNASEVRSATEHSDWQPAELRDRNTVLFVQVRDVDVENFKPLLRLIIGQHLQVLMDTVDARPDKPVTFMLDELPQLGEFPEVIRAIELGRGSRVRVWGFVQDLAQIKSTYKKASVLTNSTAIQTYLSFDMETAELLSKMYGTKHDVLRDQRVPVAEPADFLKPEMRNQMVICARGSQPVSVAKRMAFELMPELLGLPYTWTQDGLPPVAGDEPDMD